MKKLIIGGIIGLALIAGLVVVLDKPHTITQQEIVDGAVKSANVSVGGDATAHAGVPLQGSSSVLQAPNNICLQNCGIPPNPADYQYPWGGIDVAAFSRAMDKYLKNNSQ